MAARTEDVQERERLRQSLPDCARSAAAPPTTHEESYAGTIAAIEIPGSLLTLTLGSFVISPIVHLAKGNPRSAAISFGLHLGLPLLFGALGEATAPKTCTVSGDWGCDTGPVFTGYVLGITTAMIVDYTLLAHRTVPNVVVAPIVGPDRATLSLVGQF